VGLGAGETAGDQLAEAPGKSKHEGSNGDHVNAGPGDGGEGAPGEHGDRDPGKSGAHNNAPDSPPGRSK